MDWDQCDNCGKLGSALGFNELGLCPECAADDSVMAAKEEELLASKVNEHEEVTQ